MSHKAEWKRREGTGVSGECWVQLLTWRWTQTHTPRRMPLLTAHVQKSNLAVRVNKHRRHCWWKSIWRDMKWHKCSRMRWCFKVWHFKAEFLHVISWNPAACGGTLTPLTSTTLIFPAGPGIQYRRASQFRSPVWSARPSFSVDICVDLVATVSRLRDQWLRANQLQWLSGLCLGGFTVAFIYRVQGVTTLHSLLFITRTSPQKTMTVIIFRL